MIAAAGFTARPAHADDIPVESYARVTWSPGHHIACYATYYPAAAAPELAGPVAAGSIVIRVTCLR